MTILSRLVTAKPARALAILGFCAFVAACGGGGGDAPANVAPVASTPTPSATPSPSPSASPTMPPAMPAVSGFAPSIAAAGAQITVSGTNLAGVTQVRMGAVAATPANVSATQLQFSVPTGAVTNRVEVVSAAGSSLSANSLTVIAVPAIASVSATTVKQGDVLTINGANLDQVKSVLIGSVTLPFSGTRSATAVSVSIPSNAQSGALVLVALDDVARTSAQQITVNVPLAITSFTPTQALVGANVTINGTGLSRVTSVTFNGSTTAAAIGTRSATSMTVTVPAGATTGPITLTVSPTESARSTTNFTVIPRITVDGNATYAVSGAGQPVTIPGTGLDQVGGVTVAGTAATVTSRTATQLIFNAPSGLACGAITLTSTNQPSVAAGTLTIGAGCSSAVNISGIEFAQVLSQAAQAQYHRINPGQETWVRAYVTSPTANRAAPAVRVVGFNGATQLGQLTMTGPTVLPQLAAGTAPTNAMRYDITQTFRVQLPATWVASGLRVRVEADPGNVTGAATSQEATPTIGSATKLEVVMVPLVSGTNTPTMPAASDVLNELARVLPIARDQITVTIRAPYTLNSSTDGVDTSDEWRNALSEVDQLREREAPTKLHYGMVRPMVSAGTAGIGYVNPVNDFSPNLASLGWDASRTSWSRTMIHELGHNFSREHAPCGNVADADTDYPYAGGAMGAAPLFDSGNDTVVAPGTGSTQYDVMGYCSGRWFSDYNFSFVQQFLEYQRSQGRLAVQSKTGQAPGALLVITGTLDTNGARIDSVLPDTGVPNVLDAGTHELELSTADGRVIRVPVAAKRIDHADAQHFTARIAHPGALTKLRVLHAGKAIGERGASALMKSASGSSDVPWARVEETGTTARFVWNASHGTATITHVAAGQRTVLALQARDGTAQLDVSSLPRGGVFEIGLSDGLNVQTLTLAR
jgi:hypothetical protein